MIEEVWIASLTIQGPLAEKYGAWARECIERGDSEGAYYCAMRAAFHAAVGLAFAIGLASRELESRNAPLASAETPHESGALLS